MCWDLLGGVEGVHLGKEQFVGIVVFFIVRLYLLFLVLYRFVHIVGIKTNSFDIIIK
jgi:hypothetical protein